MQGARAGMVSEEVAGESVGTPTLTATGNPSDGEMGQLLTREIKSHGDGEYLYAHLLTQREDAPSWTTVELHFLAPNRAAFPGGGGSGFVGTVAAHHPPTEAKTRRKTCWDRPENLVVTPWSPPMGREDSKIHSIALT